MDNKHCKKCGVTLQANHQGELCAACAKKRKRAHMIITAGVVVGAFAGGFYLGTHPEVRAKIKSRLVTCKKKGHAALTQAMETVKDEGANALTELEKQRAELAKALGLFTNEMAQRAKQGVETGVSSVDAYLRSWKPGDAHGLSKWADQIGKLSKSELDQLMARVKKSFPDMPGI